MNREMKLLLALIETSLVASGPTSEQNPRVQQDQRAAAEAEARLVEDSLTWGAPGLALITEHRNRQVLDGALARQGDQRRGEDDPGAPR